MKNSILKKFLSLILVVLMLCIPIMTASCNKNNADNGKDNSKNDKYEEALKDPERKSFIDDIGGVSESFKGTISEKSYSSSDEAAKAFVSEELAGSENASISSVKSSGELNIEDVYKLNIPADILKGSDSVEEVEVTYELSGDSSLYSGNTTLLAVKKYTVKVYVIKYGVDWKYFTPMPINGDTINKSYYDSVFDSEKYRNSTMEATSNIEVVISAEGEVSTVCISTEQLIKHADGKIYMEQSVSQIMSGAGIDTTTKTEVYAYLEEIGGKVVCYVKMKQDGNWIIDDWIKTDITSIGFNNLDELIPFHDQYLDYTYFTKTAYGFELADENAQAYFKQALQSTIDSLGVDIDSDGFKSDMYAEYYVNEGALSGARVDADVDITMEIEGSAATIKEKVSSVIKCTGYGKTVVEIPEVKA